MSLQKYDFWHKQNNGIRVKTSDSVLEIGFVETDIIRLKLNKSEIQSCEETFVVEKNPEYLSDYEVTETSHKLILKNDRLRVEIQLDPLSIKVLNEDGSAIVSTATAHMGEFSDNTTIIRFKLDKNERIYGLGQDPMANLNQRDKERRMWQEWSCFETSGNAGIPFYLSSSGYGLLLNSSWPSRFAIGKAEVAKPGHQPLWAPAPWSWEKDSGETVSDELSILLDGGIMDLFIICRSSVDEIHKGYVNLTGHPPMIPKWALGFIQCKNRYRSQEELLYMAKEFRKRNIPCDVLVIDWLWFKEFGDLEWFAEKWPDPEGMLKELAEMGIKVLQAQHPFIEKNSLKYAEFKAKGYLNNLPSDKADVLRPTYDHSNPEARKAWWDQISRFFNEGICGYWTDMGELEVHPKGTESYLGSRERAHNIYSTLWVKGLYDGQRSISNQRVFSLPRTAYAGIQRYGAALWSGDINSTWEVFRDQVVIGQGVCLSGQQYWCTDIGGFFTDERFSAELYIRWFQWGTFCPIFRTHGTRPDNEPWNYGHQSEAIIVKFINLRYRLMPYIYSCARKVTEAGTPIMRAMIVDFAKDTVAAEQTDQFMFGPALLVAPLVEKGARIRKVYLPAGIWYDFWTGEKYSGKCWIDVPAPLSNIPLFVKAGSIIPMGPEINYTDEKVLDTIELHVYAGDKGVFELYEDDGKTYAYENGDYVKTAISLDKDGNVTTGVIDGKKELIPENRQYQVILHNGQVKTIDRCQAVVLHSDTDISCNGVCTISALVSNMTGSELDIEATLNVPSGWKLFPRVSEKVSASIKEYHLLQWQIRPYAVALPLVNHATIQLEIKNSANTGKVVENLTWGSGYATRWHIVGNFNNDDGKGLDRCYEVEENTELAYYTEDDRKLSWERNTFDEFNCFGYVDFPRPPVSPNITKGIISQGAAYAKCSIWSEEDTSGFMEISGEPCLKIWINGKLQYESHDIVLKQSIDKPILLKMGWNTVMIKSAIFCKRPNSGREFGFNFRIVDENGNIMDNLLYKA